MSAAVPSGWDRRRNLLLDKYERIALEQFASRGFKAVTVDEIARLGSHRLARQPESEARDRRLVEAPKRHVLRDGPIACPHRIIIQRYPTIVSVMPQRRDETVERSARNLDRTTLTTVDQLNAWDIMRNRTLLMTKDGLQELLA